MTLMTTTSSLQDDLKQATKKSHQTLEKKLVKVMRGIKTKHDYVKFLRMIYGYYAAVEKEIDRYLPYIQTAHIRTAHSLLSDINKHDPANRVKMCKDLPAIDSLTSALGVMYVIEGSMMGAPHITKMLSSQVDLGDQSVSSFFNLTDEEIAVSWRAFQSNFNRDFEDDERRSIIRAAEGTFTTFCNWIEDQEREHVG